MALVVVLAGGGTGGHVYPALAIADAIRKCEPQAQLRFVGTERGLEARVVRQAGYPLDFVPARAVLGRGPLGALAALLSIARGVRTARRLLARAGAQLVIGVGGYASVPAVLAAATLRLPIGLLEPNARPGRANRLLSRFARAVFVQFDAAQAFFPAGRALVVGFPVRQIPRRSRDARDGTLHLLVVGGSQGARSINEAVLAALPELAGGQHAHIVHQTGPAHYEEVRAAYQRAGVAAEAAPFFEDLPERIARADLVVARAGAATVAELCMAGVPSILVPYPHAADDHQLANARELERAGAARVLLDGQVREGLAAAVRELAGDPARLRAMAGAAAARATPDAAERIWRICAGWLPGPREGEKP
jgi:UDP-N-acetylglucosamine--N-acetylmuramyl-(pentapeptide) pyrophosphoryl-undecaprenol N-acetylglucosamine transferase